MSDHLALAMSVIALLFALISAGFAVATVRLNRRNRREAEHIHGARCHPSADGCPDRPGM